MSFLRRTYPLQLTNYTGDYLPDALDLITAAHWTSPTPSPLDKDIQQRHCRRRRHHRWNELDLQLFCRHQLMATHEDRRPATPRVAAGDLAEFWRRRRKRGSRPRRRRQQPPRVDAVGIGDHNLPETVEETDSEDYVNIIVPPDIEEQSVLIAVSLDNDTSIAEVADNDDVAVYNTTNVNMYFKTAHVLHYASIVILGLFVLQVLCN